MKRIIFLLVTVIMCLALIACGTKTPSVPSYDDHHPIDFNSSESTEDTKEQDAESLPEHEPASDLEPELESEPESEPEPNPKPVNPPAEDCITCEDGSCVLCRGSGVCPYCEGTGEMLCATCNGTNLTINAGTSKGEKSTECNSRNCNNGIETCWRCDGSKRCSGCDGQKRCFTCLGAGDYSLIDRRKTQYSYDYSECDECGGSGNDTCTRCTDGSCPSCGGDGLKECTHVNPDNCNYCDNGYIECKSCRGYGICAGCRGVYQRDCEWCIDGVSTSVYGFILPPIPGDSSNEEEFGKLCSNCGGKGMVDCSSCTAGWHNSCSGEGCSFCSFGRCACLGGYLDCPYCEDGYPYE